jgi:uncharacterized membrane protein
MFGKKKEDIKFSESDLQLIAKEITEQELHSSGEIRVEIRYNRHIGDDAVTVYEMTQREFNRLEMHKTRDKTGVLIFFLVADREFCIYADAGLRIKEKPAVWREIAVNMSRQISKKAYTQGIVNCVREVGLVLRTHFPPRPDDVNELSNEVIVS